MELIVDGHYLSALTAWGDLEWSLSWPGYSDELTFDIASHSSILKPGKIGSLVWGGEKLFTGVLEEPARGQKLRLSGLHRLGEDYAALDGSGNLSLTPDTVIDAAIARGLPWSRVETFNNPAPAPLGVDSPSTVTQVIDGNTAIHPPPFVGIAWGVLPTGVLSRRMRPAPRLHIRPGGDGLGIAWDNYASTLIARYVDSATHVYTTVIWPPVGTPPPRWGYKEVVVPNALNDGAEMTLAQAQAILDSMLAAGRSRPGWTQAIEVQYGAVLNNYQQPVDLASIRPYEVVRVHGLIEDVGDLAGQSYVDMPLARINHNPRAGTATLTPVGLVSPMTDVLSGKK